MDYFLDGSCFFQCWLVASFWLVVEHCCSLWQSVQSVHIDSKWVDLLVVKRVVLVLELAVVEVLVLMASRVQQVLQ